MRCPTFPSSACAFDKEASTTGLTRGRIGSALFNPFVICGSPPVVSAGLTPRTTDYVAPHADSQSFFNDRVVCACTHYLVFKEPTRGRQPGAARRVPLVHVSAV